MKQVVVALAVLMLAVNLICGSEKPPESTLQMIPASPEEEPNECLVGFDPSANKVVPPFSFKIEPLELNGRLLVPAREVANRIGASIYQIDGKYFIEKDNIRFKMPDNLIKVGDIALIPLILLRDLLKLKIDYDKERTYLGIGDFYWKLGTQKRIIIDKARQRLYCFEGVVGVFDTHTVTARKGYITPVGIYQITHKIPGWHKVRGKKWSGMMYYPLYFNGPGDYAIHGSTSMPSRPASHGCCRLSVKHKKGRKSPSVFVYDWAPIGTTVYIVENP